MTNKEIMAVAMNQSAVELNAAPEDFTRDTPVMTSFHLGPTARKYYKEPIACNRVSYGSNIVAAVQDAYRPIVEEYLNRYTFYHCFETPNIHWLDQQMQAHGQRVCFMAEYFLPDVSRLAALPCAYPTQVLTQADFAPLYLPTWSNALCAGRKELDVLGVGAYHQGQLIGLAACSADCDSMWQIGVDVLPEYRKQGIASSLTSRLALEILSQGRVPFYCCAWSNIRSARNAIKSGFAPAWAEMTVKPAALVEQMNQPVHKEEHP